ncbi:MAG TPA: GreA/GreB family elongation factor, partial [Tepidisphaeraceae bacterium]|nr:GreA/GreB family elongation factor [Tepidisphaeraceae bacterium]
TDPNNAPEERSITMLVGNRTIPIGDKVRLTSEVERARSSWLTYAPYLDVFRTALLNAEGVPTEQVPEDVITMNSRFAVSDPQTHEAICYTLVYPEDEAMNAGRVSALSPMGVALVGARVGDQVCWPSPNGLKLLRVQRLIYQPESAGGYRP